MRGIETPITKIRRQVFTEVAKVAFESENINDDIEAIPYRITPSDVPLYRDSIYRERAIAGERVRLAMGMSLRPESQPVHITSGLNESNISDKYYEPPLMQVIPSACAACEESGYEVSDQCRGCVAHPCQEVCPRGAISMVNGRSYIDKEKCIKCGKCKAICPYDAIAKKQRPCAVACGVKAISSDEHGRAHINDDVCVKCGQCMVSCPFGAIADKSQIFQLIQAIKRGDQVIAEVAPAFVGQFGPLASPEKVRAALRKIGFAHIYEVARGADIGAVEEAEEYIKNVPTGKLPFLATSCCPSWIMMAKQQFPQIAHCISDSMTPMVATARIIKEKHPNARVVFIGPCASKKLEAMREDIRSDVDFVITFEELMGIFQANNIEFSDLQDDTGFNHGATASGRGYGVAGGVAKAVTDCIREMAPELGEIKTDHAEGLVECKKMLTLAKLGKRDGYLLEGMACPGGCVGGAGTLTNIPKGAKAEQEFAAKSEFKVSTEDKTVFEKLGKYTKK